MNGPEKELSEEEALLKEAEALVSVRRVVESYESVVIQGW
jgi:hypothetical protein